MIRYRGDSVLQIKGTRAVGQIYITAKEAAGDFSYSGKGMALQQQKNNDETAWKLVSVFTISASVLDGHGTVSPKGEISVRSGEDQTFDFIPEEGYKVEQILLDNHSVDERSQSYTIHNVTADHSLQVVFAPLVAEDLKEAVQNATPAEQDQEQHKEDVLDAKIIYEQLSSEEKAKVPDTTLTQMNKDLAGLGSIDIHLEKDVNISTEVDSPNLYDLATAITREEAEKLKTGKMTQIRLKLVINPLEGEKVHIDPNKTSYIIGMHMDISIVKQVNGGAAEKVSATAKPIQIVTAIPSALQAPERTYVMLRSHDGKIDVLPDLDKDSETITVESNLFSTYAIAYTKPSAPVTPDKAFTVKFDSQGGSATPPITDVKFGSLISAPQEPVKEGFIFGGWYK
ncbi:InlB B-repeat-containing protein [Eubacteriales bacterium DFI.9.88]|nr:InlB B-repeat-containing protein [Eubacteriales bacterium DFI.9.88]